MQVRFNLINILFHIFQRSLYDLSFFSKFNELWNQVCSLFLSLCTNDFLFKITKLKKINKQTHFVQTKRHGIMTVQHTLIIDFPSIVCQWLCLFRCIKYPQISYGFYQLFANPDRYQSTFQNHNTTDSLYKPR